MSQGNLGLVGETPPSQPRPARRRSVCGKLGLALSLVPWAVIAAFCLLQPG